MWITFHKFEAKDAYLTNDGAEETKKNRNNSLNLRLNLASFTQKYSLISFGNTRHSSPFERRS